MYVNGFGVTTLADKDLGSGITAAQVAGGGWTGLQFDVSTTSDFNGLIRTIDASSDRAAFYGAYDIDRNGTVTQAELGNNLVFRTANTGGGVLRSRLPGRHRPAGDVLEGRNASSCRMKSSSAT